MDRLKGLIKENLTEGKVAVAVPIAHKNALQGILLMGPRRSGRLFDGAETEGLQMLCNQLGMAIENARLYTSIQHDKIHNDILLDSLTTGVVAVAV